MADRKLNVDIRGDNRNLKKSLKDSEGSVGNFGKAVSRVGGMLAGAFAAGAIIGGIKKLTTELGQAADRLLDLADITGMSTDKLQEYQHVAKIAGVNTETVSNAAQGLTRRLARATTESSTLNQHMRELGINTTNASGELRDMDDIMDEAIKKLAAMDNQTERNTKGAALFGGAWRDMAPILSKGSEEIERLRKEAHTMGGVMDREAIDKANKFREEMVKLEVASSSLGRELGLMLMPVLTAMASGMVTLISRTKELASGLGSVNSSQTLSFWQKLGTYVGLVSGNAALLGNSLKNIANAQAERLQSVEAIAEKAEQENKAMTEAVLLAEEQARLERERLESLGEIGRLQEELAEAEAGFISANSEAERAKHHKRMEDLRTYIELMKEAASAEAAQPFRSDTSSLEPMTNEGSQSIDGGHDAFIDRMKEQQIELRNTVNETEKAARAYTELDSTINESAYSIGAAFGQMAADGKSSSRDLIKQAISVAIAQLMKQAAISIPFPFSIAAMAGAGAAGHAIMGSIPRMKDGGIVPGGYPNDTYPALLSSGETVTPPHKLPDSGMGGKVEFEIRGDKLYGLLNRHVNRIKSNK